MLMLHRALKQKIGTATYTGVFASHGTMSLGCLTFLCLATSSRSSKNKKHASPPRQQHCPYAPMPTQNGSKAHRPLPPNTSPPLSDDNIKHVQQVISSILYYACTVDLTVLMVLSTIAGKQTKGMVNTRLKKKPLVFLAMHPNAIVRFHTSNMILNIHLDASYHLEANAHSQACGFFFMGLRADPIKPIRLNGACLTLCAILCFIVVSAAKSKLSTLFLDCKQATIFRLTPKKMGHPQPPTLMHCNCSTAVGIANITLKR